MTGQGCTFEQTAINRPFEPCPPFGCLRMAPTARVYPPETAIWSNTRAAALAMDIGHRGISIGNINSHKSGSARVSTAVLLAAGSGSRLNPLTNDVPKCLAEIDGIPILEHQVACLRRWGFKKLVIVVGHLEHSIRHFLDSLGAGIDIEYVSNPRFKTTNNNYSLWLARERLSQPFLLLECDLVFEASLLERMLHPNAIAVSPKMPWMSGSMVELDGVSAIKRLEVSGCAGTGGLS